jgi:hypothetical protein
VADGTEAERTPRWVKVIGVVLAVGVVLVVVLILTGRGGSHGPGRHALAVGAGNDIAFPADYTGRDS